MSLSKKQKLLLILLALTSGIGSLVMVGTLVLFVAFRANQIEQSRFAKRQTKLTDMSSWFAKNFNTFDADGNGTITSLELDTLIANPKFHGSEAVYLSTLRCNLSDWTHDYEPVKENTDGHVTLKGIENFNQFVATKWFSVYEIEWTTADWLELDFQNQSKWLQKSRSLKDDSVYQGYGGTCSAIAPLVSIMSRDVKFMDRIVASKCEAGSNVIVSYVVTFPGDPNTPVEVLPPTDAELALYANGLKAAVIEKAMATYVANEYAAQAKALSFPLPAKFASPLAIEQVSVFNIDPCKALLLLTAEKKVVLIHNEHTSSNNLHLALQYACSKRKSVLASTPTRGGITLPKGMQYNHMYSCLYDASTSTVALTNPRHPEFTNSEPRNKNDSPKDGKLDGKFTLSLAEFQEYFNGTYIAGDIAPNLSGKIRYYEFDMANSGKIDDLINP